MGYFDIMRAILRSCIGRFLPHPSMTRRFLIAVALLAAASYSFWPSPPSHDETGSVGSNLVSPASQTQSLPATGSAEKSEVSTAQLPGKSNAEIAAAEPSTATASLLKPAAQWAKTPAEPQFAEFKQWTQRWQEAAVKDSALESEGVKLALARRKAMADLISGMPDRALELSVPNSIAKDLPAAVREQLETRINARGDFSVIAGMPLPGMEDRIASMARFAEIGGKKYHAFVGKEASQFVTKKNVAINGIALPASAATNPPDESLVTAENLLAVSASPVRLLDTEEIEGALADAPVPPSCPTSGDPITIHDEPEGLEIGGETYLYCGPRHVMTAASNLTNAEGLTTAGAPTSAASGEGTVFANFGTITNGYTQGYKRMLILRVDFPDFVGDVDDGSGRRTIDAAEATTLLADLRSYLHLMSYGTHELAPLGPNGSAFTPVLRMSGNAATYNDKGLDTLYPEAKTKAEAAGYDLSKFDWFGVFTGARPGAGYAGLAYVGGVGFHMANGYYSKHVVTHEFGHNLGLPHAHRWDTTSEATYSQTVIGNGTQVEYGNPYDPIGATYDGVPGEKHYVGGYKTYLGWIPSGDSPLVTTSGVYRLTTSDDVHALGRRNIRLAKDGRNYWLEFRAGFSDDNLRRGVFLQWGNANGSENSILDVRPSDTGKAIVMGQTFSDPTANGNAGVHVTPIGYGGTSPESMDVYVQVGTLAGNLPPSAVISSNTTGVSTQPTAAPFPSAILFSVKAADPNNDALAYFWDFGDGSISNDNLPNQTHTYASAGDYMAQVCVSDMKGGVARDSVMIRVEPPNTPPPYITGRVLDTSNQPIGGIRITATNGSEKHATHTDSDGIYTLTGLSAKTWTITALEEVSQRYAFANPFFTNPITLTTTNAVADFVGSVGASETLTAIVAKNAAWKYYSVGAEPAAGWNGTTFDDSAWAVGNGVLGYGNEAGQTTTLPFGGNSAAKWVSYYFRKTFPIADKNLFASARLRTLRDDGVIVYLNGVEVYRENMPAGAVTYNTFATDNTEPSAYLDQDITLANLISGTNTIAVEIHQSTASSSDVAFDLALDGVSPLGGTGSVILAITSPTEEQTFTTPVASIPLSATALVKNGTVAKVEFYVDGTKIGESTTSPFTTNWTSPALGSHILKCVATLGDASTETSSDRRVNIVAPLTNLIPSNASWKYLSSATAPAANWFATNFVDTTWSAGLARLGVDSSGVTTTINIGPTGARYPTVYFRKAFTLADPSVISSLLAKIVRDDGMAVYLNGVEVIRNNLPIGTLAYATLAAAAGSDPIETLPLTYTIDKSLLVPGNNVIAAEVHQSSLTSSDLVFELSLDAVSGTANPRGLTLVAPTSATFPASVEMTTTAVAGGTLGITKVDFYADGVKVGTDTSHPFSYTWNGATVGSKILAAIATDSASATINSNAINLNVSPAWKATSLVSFGDTWKYLDTGVAPAATWTARTGFDDSAWLGGISRLGYGGDGEATVINYGNERGAKYMTTWFRKSFTVSNPANFSQLLLRLVRDDGAIVYINGVERFRTNLPEGTITSTTEALTAIGNADETTPIEAVLPTTGLVAGANVIAIELHQSSTDSSDLGMNCELIGQAIGGGTFYLTNPSASQLISAAVDFPLTVNLPGGFGTPSKVEYFAGAAKIGESTTAPYSLTWTTPLLGTYALTAKATFTNATTATTAGVTITIDQSRLSTTFLAAGATWKYLDTGVAPAANWSTSAFDDTAWKSGPARLGFGADTEITAIESGRISYYFRSPITVPANAALGSVILRFQRDDGIVFYLDGVELFRNNMPSGTISATTPASVTVNAPDETKWFTQTLASTTGLTAGTHILSAEVHQTAATSSDLGFDAELIGYGTDASVIANTQPTVQPQVLLDRVGVPAGQFRFYLPDASANGRLYLIQSSPDMVTWTPYSYEFVRSGSVQLPITPTGIPKRFFRAKWAAGLP